MNDDGQDYLDTLADFGRDTFDGRFSALSKRFDLRSCFSRNEFSLLREAASRAMACQASFNQPDPHGAGPKSEDERRRHSREIAFLESRDALFASPGWQDLPGAEQVLLEEVFLSVAVAESRLRW